MLYCCASATLDASYLDECMIALVSTCLASPFSHVFQAQNLEKRRNSFQCPIWHFSADFILCKKKKKYCFQKHQSEKSKYSIEQQSFETGFGQDSVYWKDAQSWNSSSSFVNALVWTGKALFKPVTKQLCLLFKSNSSCNRYTLHLFHALNWALLSIKQFKLVSDTVSTHYESTEEFVL